MASLAEVEARGLADAGHDGHHGLDARLLLQAVEHAVDAVRGGWGEDALRVARVAVFVLDVYLGQVVGGVYFLLSPQTERQAQEEYQQWSDSFHAIFVLCFGG